MLEAWILRWYLFLSSHGNQGLLVVCPSEKASPFQWFSLPYGFPCSGVMSEGLGLMTKVTLPGGSSEEG